MSSNLTFCNTLSSKGEGVWFYLVLMCFIVFEISTLSGAYYVTKLVSRRPLNRLLCLRFLTKSILFAQYLFPGNKNSWF